MDVNSNKKLTFEKLPLLNFPHFQKKTSVPAVAGSSPDSRRSEVVVEADQDWVLPRYP